MRSTRERHDSRQCDGPRYSNKEKRWLATIWGMDHR